jgi:Spy/CpxP family protein refolding chaperone
MRLILIAILTVMTLALLPPAAPAEDVKVDVIEPDKRPDTAERTDKGDPADAPEARQDDDNDPVETGSRLVDRMFSRLDLTADQAARINPMLTDYAARRQADIKGHEQRVAELSRQLRAAAENKDEETADKLRGQIRDVTREHYANRMKTFNEFVDQAADQLPADKAQQLKRMRDERTTTAGRARRGARMLVSRMADDLELTDSQRQQAEEMLAARMTRIMETQEQNGPRMRELWGELRKAREADDEARVEQIRKELGELRTDWGKEFRQGREDLMKVLTPEQQAKLQKQEQERRDQRNRRSAEFATGPAKRLDSLTDQQRKQIESLEAAAIEAMGGQDMDRDARRALTDRLRQDVVALLTEEQKAAYTKAVEESRRRWGRGRRGGGRRGGGDRGRDRDRDDES